MKNNHIITTCLLLLFAAVTSCTREQKEAPVNETQVQKPLNPNGDSELALLMRAMFDEAERIKKQIANGAPITFSLNHEEMLTAEATEPEKATSAEYKTYANLYLHSIKNLQSAKPDQYLNLYDNMVNNCMTCHKAMCPGPIVKIKKLQ